jgi:hypothetical protein
VLVTAPFPFRSYSLTLGNNTEKQLSTSTYSPSLKVRVTFAIAPR